jgi:hypothetical protein
MIKTIFVLVIVYLGQGGVDTRLTFQDLQQCEAARSSLHPSLKAVCIKQEIPVEKPRKIKCSIENKTDYQSTRAGAYNQNMERYPYPVSFTCVEE